MDIVQLSTLDQAKSLAACAYEIYGLTFHRGWLYDPEQILALNQAGDVLSFLAIDGGKVVGHLGMMRPSWDVRRDGVPISDPGLREIGLSIVHPDYRGQGVQALLGGAAFERMIAEKAHGAYMKCVTHHTRSQRGALRFGGVPITLSLGSVPRYIVYEGEVTDPTQPISTLGYYVPFNRLPAARAWLPEGQRWLEGVAASAGLERSYPEPMPVVGPTDLEVRWQADRQLAQIYVLRPGADLIERLRERMRWLVGGHMAHISVYLPTDSPALQAAGPALRELGLFSSGLLPGFFRGGRDALILQAMAFSQLDPASVQVTGAAGVALREQVIQGWRDAQGRTLRLLDAGRRGRVRAQVQRSTEKKTG